LCLIAVLTAFAALSEREPVYAQFFTTYTWIDPLGGSYNSSSNWSPDFGGSGIPNGPEEGARFNLSSFYTVDLPTDIATASASVTDGNVRWDLNSSGTPRTYTLDALAVDPSISGGAPVLEVTGGSVDTSQLRVENGGQLHVLPTGTVDVTDGTVSGASSIWTNSGLLHVGQFQGTGSLTIEQGGSVSSPHSRIGVLSNSTGTVTVTGENSNWAVGGELLLGQVQSNANGSLIIEDGGSVTNTSDGLSARVHVGTVNVNGPGSTWTNTGSLSIEVGELTIEAGGSVSNTAGAVGSPFGSSTGTVTVTGAASTWTNSEMLHVAPGVGGGILTIEAGGSVSNTSAEVGKTGTGTVSVTGDGSNWTITEQLSIGSDVSNGRAATLTINSGGTVSVVEEIILLADSLVSLQGGSLTTTDFDLQGGQFQWTSGTLHVDQFDGNLTNPAGGTLAPGRSAGSTMITGSYTQQASAALEIEIGGKAIITEHDFVNVSGTTLLGGELQLNLIDDFTPASTDRFTVLNSVGGVAGVFTNVSSGQRLDTMDGLGSFLVHYGPGSAFNQNQIVLTGFEVAGDFDLDGDVDGSDFLKWQQGESPTPLSSSDLATWEANYGTVAPLSAASTSVPEPTSLALIPILCLGGLLSPPSFRRATSLTACF